MPTVHAFLSSNPTDNPTINPTTATPTLSIREMCGHVPYLVLSVYIHWVMSHTRKLMLYPKLGL